VRTPCSRASGVGQARFLPSRAAIRSLSENRPVSAWPGHAIHLTEEVLMPRYRRSTALATTALAGSAALLSVSAGAHAASGSDDVQRAERVVGRATGTPVRSVVSVRDNGVRTSATLKDGGAPVTWRFPPKPPERTAARQQADRNDVVSEASRLP
jgi:hypothetical protein